MVANLTLSSSAKLAFIGLGYIYLVKLIDTLWHGIFAPPTISFVVVCLNILAGIAQLLFFYKLKSSTSTSGIFSNIAGWAGIIGALITIIPKILALSILLQFYFSFNSINKSPLIQMISLTLGAVLLFCCCLIFSFLTAKIWSNKSRYFLIGSIGYMILTVTYSKLVLNYFSGFKINCQWGEIDTSLAYLIISESASFLCIAYFYAGFFSGNEDIGNDEN